MLNSDILNVAIGLFVIFFVFATVCSGVTEGIQWLLRQRADYLLTGIRALIEGEGWPAPTEAPPAASQLPPPGSPAPVTKEPPGRFGDPATTAKALLRRIGPRADAVPPVSSAQRAADSAAVAAVLQGTRAGTVTGQDVTHAVLGHPLVAALGRRRAGDPLDKHNAPSYLPSRVFGRTVVDLLTPADTGDMADVTVAIGRLPNNIPMRGALESFVSNAEGSLDRFRLQVEQWYDDHMDRVSGWYSRWARSCVLVLAILVAIAFNVNPIGIARSLYTDPTTRQLVANQAPTLTTCPSIFGSAPSTSTPSVADVTAQAHCVRQQVKAVQGTDLPLFWRTSAACALPNAGCSLWEEHGMTGWGLVTTVVGLVLGAGALAMGAPFWFDLLGRLASLRPSGPKPAPATPG